MHSDDSASPVTSPAPEDSFLLRLARTAMDATVGADVDPLTDWPRLNFEDPAQRVFGDYELLEEIGRGGMGVVYRARQRSLDREVAIKFIADHMADAAHLARFFSEARAAARLNHPHIVLVHEVGHIDSIHYFSMPMVRGRTLAELIQHPLSPRQAVELLLKLCDAIDYAHRLGLLHLDLKPANILIDERGEPLVADFGLARRMDAEGGVDAQEVSGTPSCMAPEQILIRQYRMTPATDLYALGAMLYQCLVGVSPHGGGLPDEQMQTAVAGRLRPITEVNRKIPADLAAVTMKCLQLLPKDRYPSVAAFADDLRRVRDGHAVSVRKAGAVERLRLWVRREPRVAAASAAAALALLAGTTATAAQWSEAAQQRDLAVNERDVAVQQRELAEGMAALGAWLYGQNLAEDRNPDDDGSQFTERMLTWLRERYPGDEVRQAAVLTSFAQAARGERRDPSSDLLLPVIQILGGEYRQQMIQALVAGDAPNRYAMAARLAWFDERQAEDPRQFRALMDAAIAAQPDNPEVWDIAATYCTGNEDARRCFWPQAAQRLVELEPENAYHWILRVNETSGDLARENLRQAAQRTYFSDKYRENVAAYFTAVEMAGVPVPELIAGPARAVAPDLAPELVVSAVETSSFPLVPWKPFLHRCDPASRVFADTSAYADCKSIGLTMARDSVGTLLSSMVGVMLVRRLAKGTPLEQEMIELRRNFVYVMEVSEQLSREQLLNYPFHLFHTELLRAGELEAWKGRLAYYGFAPRPPLGWQPRDPTRLLLPEDKQANPPTPAPAPGPDS